MLHILRASWRAPSVLRSFRAFAYLSDDKRLNQLRVIPLLENNGCLFRSAFFPAAQFVRNSDNGPFGNSSRLIRRLILGTETGYGLMKAILSLSMVLAVLAVAWGGDDDEAPVDVSLAEWSVTASLALVSEGPVTFTVANDG